MSKRVLVIDDEPSVRRLIEHHLKEENYKILSAENGEKGLRLIDENSPHLVLLDVRLPGIGGIEILQKIKEAHPKLPVIMITAYGTVKMAVETMRKGAYDFLVKPIKPDELKITVRNAITTQTLQKEVEFLKSQLEERYEFSNIIGKSPAMQQVFKLIEKVTDSDMPVLIEGQSGIGKELVAKAIHFNGPRKEAPFMDINCAAIPETLLESELFGHEKGAFTNAVKRKEGKFELADRGTLFLDEIGEMNFSLQAKILRVLQEKTFERIGGKEKIRVNCRIISATNKDLKDEIKKKKFREDLYYRIAVFPIRLSPLKERREDILLLVPHFLKKYANKRKPKKISPEAMKVLTSYDWPGNVRELENVIYRTTVLTEGDTIELSHLPLELQNLAQTSISSGKSAISLEDPSSHEIIPFEEIEKEVLRHALKVSDGNISKATRELGIGRATFYRKLKKYNLIDEDF